MDGMVRRMAWVVALLVLAATSLFGQSTGAALAAKGDGLILKHNGITAELGLAEGGLLRITATMDGATPRPIPDAMTIPVARVSAAPSREGNGWKLGSYVVRMDGVNLAVAKDGQPRFTVRFEKAGAAGVRTPLVLEQGEALYGMG